jgi:hypothetical protein
MPPQERFPATYPMTSMPAYVPDASSLMAFGAFPDAAQVPIDFMPVATTQASLQEAAAIHAGIYHDSVISIPPLSPIEDLASHSPLPWASGLGMDGWHDVHQTLAMDSFTRLSNSPASSFLDVLSLPASSTAEPGWSVVDLGGAIFNPSQTLHLRSNSDSSDGSFDFGSYEEIAAPYTHSPPFSPSSSEHDADVAMHRGCFGGDHGHSHSHSHSHAHSHSHSHSHPHHHHHSPSLDLACSASSAVVPLPIKTSSSTAAGPARTQASGSGCVSGAASPASTTSPTRRAPAGPRKSPISKPPSAAATAAVTAAAGTKAAAIIRRTPPGGKDGAAATEKKVGRRRGPLRPEQRKQASEIRKLRACLRCKFLKKTCDTGEPCTGCQPSHARLWQVPCTRIDIKDIAYFMKDWKADYERHMGRGVSVYNVKGFAEKESVMWITHGFGYALPVMVREVYVIDDSCFSVDWVESSSSSEPIDYQVRTEKLDVGSQGISLDALSEYLDKHVEGPFEDFVDEHFDGTPFVSEILKTAHRYYVKEKSSVIRKALKLVVAYNLTLHITMIEPSGSGDEADLEGEIDDEYSRFHGKVVAPVMVNYQIKCAMADMWRDLQKDILEELSALYHSVYSGDRLKNWPTIFLLASILLAVWEEIQFDCHYRTPDPAVVRKFCSDMETTPVGVIVGLFHAISQKLPPFLEWNTADHGHILNNNPAVCEAMTEVREHVTKHESYLRSRTDTKFNRDDFDSLSNKFLSKLVIRAN